jgi:rhodanese-related sulfurtransferase
VNSADQRPDAAAAAQLVAAGAVLLDVRTDEEWREGHIEGARLIPWQALELSSPGLPADKDAAIVTYCASGSRAELAARKLRGLGYTRVVAMTGGFQDLLDAGMPSESRA